jgi:hypothetical protein
MSVVCYRGIGTSAQGEGTPNELVPTPAEYEALIRQLVRINRLKLGPLLDRLTEERKALADLQKELDSKVAAWDKERTALRREMAELQRKLEAKAEAEGQPSLSTTPMISEADSTTEVKETNGTNAVDSMEL